MTTPGLRPKTTVYLLVADYDHEGDRVDGCFATRDAAIEAARRVAFLLTKASLTEEPT